MALALSLEEHVSTAPIQMLSHVLLIKTFQTSVLLATSM